MKKFMTLVAIILAMIVGQSLQTTAQITAGRYGVAQVFDCQRSPAYPAAGQLFTASGLARPYKDVGGQYTLGTGEYIQFFYVGGSCNSGVVGINRYNSGGGFLETISAGGRIYGLANQGFLYVSTHGDFGTFVSNSVGYNYGSSASFVTNIGLADCSQLSSYTATSTILAPGETAGGGTSTYTISGSAGVASATISYTGGSTTADGSGAYSFTVSSGWNGTSSASKTGYTFSANKTYSNVTSNQTSQNFTATLNTYTISGNAGIGSALITYTGGTTTADGSGAYSFTVNYGWSGTSSASKAGYTFSASKTYLNVASSYASQDFSATLNTYTISGNAGVASASITYTGGATTANASGLYSFTVNYGWSGTSSASKAGYTFSADKTYTNVAANQASQDFTATAIIYTLTYDGNGSNLRGSSPVNTPYTIGVTVTVANTGTLLNPNFVFTAWNTAADGTGASYNAGETFGMPTNDVTLYAQWVPVPCTKLFEFTGSTGAIPNGSLVSDGTYLYGMTYNGGTLNKGVIFKIKTDGTGYAKLMDFDGAKGANPYGSLLLLNNVLYGLTYNGGLSNKGVAFKINPDGTGFTKLVDFDGATKGSNPYNEFITDGTNLYTTTYTGGTSSKGTVIKMTTAGVVTKLVNFDGALKGANPKGKLVLTGGFLYGMTYYGGTVNMGTAFKVNTTDGSFAKILNFNGYSLPNAYGSYPLGSFATDGTYLYGMTSIGGTKNKGTAFKIHIATNVYTKIVNFDNTTNGSNPQGGFIVDDGYIYGMTYLGGAYGLGVLFKIKIATSTYYKMLDFDGTNYGSNPTGSLIVGGGYLYGMTTSRGPINMGSIFKYQIAMPSAGNFGGTDMNTNPVLVNNNDNIQSVTLQSDNSDREKFVVFPNPAKESINVLYFSETATRGAVKILDLQGRTIQHLEVEFIEGLNSKTLNTAELSKGIYFVSVGAKIQKFVIE